MWASLSLLPLSRHFLSSSNNNRDLIQYCVLLPSMALSVVRSTLISLSFLLFSCSPSSDFSLLYLPSSNLTFLCLSFSDLSHSFDFTSPPQASHSFLSPLSPPQSSHSFTSLSILLFCFLDNPFHCLPSSSSSKGLPFIWPPISLDHYMKFS